MGADKKSMLKKCGDILINIKPNKKSKLYVFNCAFCNTNCDQLKKFSLHLDEKHSKQFSQEALGMTSLCVAEDETKNYIPSKFGNMKDNLEVFEPEVKVEDLMEIEAPPVVANEETKGLIIPKKMSIQGDWNESQIDDSDQKEVLSEKNSALRYCKPKKVVSDDSKESHFDDTIDSEGDDNNLNVKTEPTSLQEADINYGQLWSKIANIPPELLENASKTHDSLMENVEPINPDKIDFDGEDINVNIKTESISIQDPDINYAQMVKIANAPLKLLENTSKTHDSLMENVEPINPDTKDFDGEDINVNIKTEPISLQEPDIIYAQMVKIANEPLELLENVSKTHDGQLENVEPINPVLVDEPLNLRDKSNMEYIQKFMKSKGDVTALITAYRYEPHLWNFNLPVQYRKKVKRIMTWKKIAIDLKKTQNLQISASQVAVCIIYLRQKYREKKRNDKKRKNCVEILPIWAFKQLKFLNSFIESKPIGLLDIHQDLAPKQTIEILHIFKRCPHLWDSNTVEFYCTNKRNEALTEMKNIISGEMDLEVEEDTLQNFLNCVRKYLVLEKRRQMGLIRGVRENVRYYDHLLFLYDHVGPFKCSHCRRKFMKPLAVKSHESKHNGTIPFKCPQCSEEFKVSHSYVCHIRRHMDDYNHECKICAKKCFRAVELEEHMRVHTGDKPFCCVICGSSFAHRASFNMHMRIHDKKYSSFCPICSKGFYNKDNMTMHARIHKDERDFVCPTCGKAFKLKLSLTAHIATHENGKYECTICGKSFKNRINLYQHKRKH